MRSIGVRELRQHASTYLRAVEQGETIEVTDRGRPVARLVPPERKPESRVEQLIREGLLIPAERPWGSHKRVEPMPGIPSASELISEMREERL